jgi:hypothetical protein
MPNLNRINSLATALVLLAGAAPALSQNALGDGRGLERDLRVGGGVAGGGNFARPDFMREVRARNALVTGNAGAGQSLRINPGYTAPDEFRGNLGSDDLFSFRRDSIQSAPGFRGTQGLQYQSAYSIGNSSAPVLTRLGQFGTGSEVPRSGFTPRNQFDAPRARTDDPNLARSRFGNEVGDQSASLYTPSAVSTMRSTGAFTSTIGLSPAMVGTTQSASGIDRFAASSLLGVRNMNLQPVEDLPDNRLTARELADRNAEQPRANSAAGPDLRSSAAVSSAASPAFRTAYDDLRMRLDRVPGAVAPTPTPEDRETPPRVNPATDPKANVPDWERRINELRERLREGAPEEPAEKPVVAPVVPKAGTPADLDRLQKESDDARAKRAADDRDKRKKLLAGLDDETLEVIKKGGGEANRYTSGTPGSLFDVHVREGENALAKGRYFDAEERFARALAMRPGDVTVMAARLNSQIGAGLYLSAAVNLRQLMETHPEVMGVRYTGGAMPAPARLKSLKEELTRTLEKAAADKGHVPEESALLLSYIGFQTNDRQSIRTGLDTLARAPSGNRDPLIPVLRRVWLEETTDQGK